MDKDYPFGWRVLVKVDESLLDNIGTKILTGTIVESSKINREGLVSIVDGTGLHCDAMMLLYLQGLKVLEEGVVVRFNYEDKVVDKLEGSIYNVPIELIRSYKE